VQVPTPPEVISKLNDPLVVTVPDNPLAPDTEVTVPVPAVLALANAELAYDPEADPVFAVANAELAYTPALVAFVLEVLATVNAEFA
jgi:hypothetical protein